MKFLKRVGFVCYGLNSAATYPVTAIWDGDSGNRDSDDNNLKAPDYRDWNRMVAELAAVQTQVGIGPDASAAAVTGAAAGTGVTASIDRSAVQRVVLTLTNVAITLIDEATVVAYGGLKIFDLPAGAILMLGATVDLAITKSSAGVNADWDGDIGIGTVTAANDATLSSTEQDIVPSTATPQAVAGVVANAHAQSTATENAVLDGTTTAKDVYLNVLVDDADHDVTTTPCDLIFNGTITLTFVNLGDY